MKRRLNVCLLKKRGLRRLNEERSLNINGTSIYLSDRVKDLGIIVDKHLNLNDHINEAERGKLPS